MGPRTKRTSECRAEMSSVGWLVGGGWVGVTSSLFFLCDLPRAPRMTCSLHSRLDILFSFVLSFLLTYFARFFLGFALLFLSVLFCFVVRRSGLGITRPPLAHPHLSTTRARTRAANVSPPGSVTRHVQMLVLYPCRPCDDCARGLVGGCVCDPHALLHSKSWFRLPTHVAGCLTWTRTNPQPRPRPSKNHPSLQPSLGSVSVCVCVYACVHVS